MKIFISWSDDLSLKIAKELKEWLGCVIQGVDVFISSEDIRKGNRWNLEMARQLDKCDFGIICLTKDNLNSPWILFESGALSKSLVESNVCTFLIGDLDIADIEGPLSQFQHTKVDKDDFRKLVSTINEKLGENKLHDLTLDKVFERWWPELDIKIKNHLNSLPMIDDRSFVKRSDKEILSEVLELTRFISQNIPVYSKEEGVMRLAETSAAYAQLKNNEDQYLMSPHGDYYNHPVAVSVYPVRIQKDGKSHLVSCKITKGEIKIEEIDRAINTSGVIIVLRFYSENDYPHYWETTFHFHKGITTVDTRIIDEEVSNSSMSIETIWRD